MQFRTLDLALATQRNLAPLVARVQRHDKKLAAQLRDATNSFVLNLGEGAASDPGTRRSRYFSAAGSASEVRAGLRAAQGWGYVSGSALAPVFEQLDHLLAALWKLTH
ncbi:MAG: four helix bundle protein [Polyangiaceae bacterium]